MVVKLTSVPENKAWWSGAIPENLSVTFLRLKKKKRKINVKIPILQ